MSRGREKWPRKNLCCGKEVDTEETLLARKKKRTNKGDEVFHVTREGLGGVKMEEQEREE